MPNPWLALQARPHLVMERLGIAEPGRYYHGHAAIVLRKGMLLSEERRHLFHELRHADRKDEQCHSSDAVERRVESDAARWAMPRRALEVAIPQARNWSDLAEILKLPEEWVRFRWRTMFRSEREHLISVNRRLARDL